MSGREFEKHFSKFVGKVINNYGKYAEVIAEHLRYIDGLQDVNAADVATAIAQTQINS